MTETATTHRHWLLVIEGDVEPYLIGPLDEHEVLPRARGHRAEDPSAEDGLYALTLDAEGHLGISAFSGADLAPKAWLLADVDSTGMLEIQRNDAAMLVADDDEALAVARAEAAAGNDEAAEAVQWHDRDRDALRHNRAADHPRRDGAGGFSGEDREGER